jgi:hypothetical protein
MRSVGLLTFILLTALILALSAAAESAETARKAPQIPGKGSVDIAPFGTATKWSDEKEAGLTVEWTERRDVYSTAVSFRDEASVPKPEEMRVEYWFSKWPNEYTGGWKELDDRWNGTWLPVQADTKQQGSTVIFRFKPLTKEENPRAEYVDFPYRRTLKVRVVVDRSAAERITGFKVYGSSVWKEAELWVETECGEKGPPLLQAD